MATAVSAAEMAMENKEKKYPSSPPGNRKTVEYSKVDVRGIQYQLDADKYRQRVAAGEEPVDACEEHDSRNYQIIFHVYHNSYLLRAINNPPTIHANNKMLTASKGSR